MRITYLTAGLIALLIVGWLASGWLGKETAAIQPTLAEQNQMRIATRDDRTPTAVRVRVSHAVAQSREVAVRGKTMNKRTVQVRSETTGTIVARPVDRGTVVAKGDLLCRLSVEDRQVGLVEAREGLNQARIEYEGSLKLKARGLQSDTAIATTKARLASAQAQLQRRELDLARTYIKAPFAGVVEDVYQEIGSYVSPGAECATIVDLDPMLVIGRVSERDVVNLTQGATAQATLSTDQVVTGTITFIGNTTDNATRTFPIELQVANADGGIRSGLTATIQIPVEQVPAHKVSPALFALDDSGAVGMRIIDANNVVKFVPVRIIRADTDGVWVAGLPIVATIITVGHQLVVAGETVAPDYKSKDSTATAPTETTPAKAGERVIPAQSDPTAKPDKQAGQIATNPEPLQSPDASVQANATAFGV